MGRVAASCVILLVVALVPAQQAGLAGQVWQTPRTAWGHADLSGTWSTATITPLERPAELAAKEWFTEAEAADYERAADYVVILAEMIHDARIVPLDGRPHLPAHLRLWMGDSVGRWEGDTLVVETTNFTDKTNYRGSTDNLRLVEQFTRTAEDILTYRVTVHDPTTFTQPWTIELPVRRSDGQIYEYACHEGNYGLEGILRGHRAEEKTAAENAARKTPK